jgi:integrase
MKKSHHAQTHTHTYIDATTSYKKWLALWLEQKVGFVKESTLATYSMAAVNHIIPALGALAASGITDDDVRTAVQGWLTNGRLDGRGGLSEKTVKDFLVIITISLSDARRSLGLPKTPLGARLLRTKPRSRVKVLDVQDHKKLLRKITQNLNHKNIGILLSLHTGLRIGELCAIRWADIDLARRTLSVTKTIQRIYVKEIDGRAFTKITITAPKTKASVRELPLSSFLSEQLARLYAAEEARIHAAKEAGAETYLLTGSAAYIEPRAYRNFFNRYLQDADIPHINFHGLRHTFATEMIRHGADVKTLSGLLGHSSVNMTMDLYVHPQMEQKRKCMELLAKTFA